MRIERAACVRGATAHYFLIFSHARSTLRNQHGAPPTFERALLLRTIADSLHLAATIHALASCRPFCKPLDY